MPVLVYGYDQQGQGYPPNLRYFDYMTVASSNAGTGVVTLTSGLTNSYDSRWWDIPNYAGTKVAFGAPRILSLQRAKYNQPRLIWLKGGIYYSNTSNGYYIQTPASLTIYEDVQAGINTSHPGIISPTIGDG